MPREIIMEGPSVPEALDAALEELGVQQDAVEFEVVDEGSDNGFGSVRNAKVRVWLKPGIELAVTEDPTDDEDADGTGAITEEELDAVADAAVEVITRITRAFGIDPTIDEYEGDEGEIILDIVDGDLGVLIGRHGRTLDALQVLVVAITNRNVERRHPVVVDVSGYRYRRRLKLEEIAKRAADRAVRQGRPVELRPMTSFERKMVHMALRNDRRVTTASEGEEPFRQVVVHPR